MTGPLYVVQMETSFTSLDEARESAPERLDEHVMAVLRTREDAEEFAAGDPFVVAGMVASQVIRPWANLLGA